MTTPTTTTFSWNKRDWVSLSEMADGFDEYRPAHSRTLDGQELTVCCRYVDSAEEFTLIQTFRDGELDWTIDGAAGAHSGTETYELFEMQLGLFYLHCQRKAETHPVVVSAALDLTSGQITGAIGIWDSSRAHTSHVSDGSRARSRVPAPRRRTLSEDRRADRPSRSLRLQQRRRLRPHLPQREPLHLALRRRRRNRRG